MFKSTTTRIFFAFAALLVIATGVLAVLFGNQLLEERETNILDTLSSRSRIEAADISATLQKNSSIENIIKNDGVVLIKGHQILSQPKQEIFSFSGIQDLLPPSGSIVTTCNAKNSKLYYCSFSYIPEAKIWLFQWIPKETIFEVLNRLIKKISNSILLLLSLSLVFAFFLSRLLLAPLRRFTKASADIARGDYDDVELPLNRGDEIGQLTKAFQKMIGDLQEREKNLALAGVKLAHSARLASVGQMGASIAHEVKNPLMSMKGYAKILAEKEGNPELKEAAEIIQKESERCNQILQQMLRFSRKEPNENKAYNLQEVVDSTLLLIKAEAKSRHVTIQNPSKISSVVMGNAQQVQQVILNLLVNALQASPQGSQVEVQSQEKDGQVCLEVVDHGSGIPPQLQDKIFEPFFTTKDKKEGSGLGLSIALNTVQEQGGSLSFESEKDHGTRFRLCLPIAKA